MQVQGANREIESWFHVWEAAVAINALCVGKGKSGIASGLGKSLFFLLSISTVTLMVLVGNGGKLSIQLGPT